MGEKHISWNHGCSQQWLQLGDSSPGLWFQAGSYLIQPRGDIVLFQRFLEREKNPLYINRWKNTSLFLIVYFTRISSTLFETPKSLNFLPTFSSTLWLTLLAFLAFLGLFPVKSLAWAGCDGMPTKGSSPVFAPGVM